MHQLGHFAARSIRTGCVNAVHCRIVKVANECLQQQSCSPQATTAGFVRLGMTTSGTSVLNMRDKEGGLGCNANLTGRHVLL